MNRIKRFTIFFIVLISLAGATLATRALTRTLAIIKPDAFNRAPQIEAEMKRAGLKYVTKTIMVLDKKAARQFYEEHSDKPFFEDLVEHMSSGVIAVYVLERRSAIQMWRAIMGPTDPNVAQAKMPSSLRARFGWDITRNAVHGSASLAAARREIAFFFSDLVGMEGLTHEEPIYDFDLQPWNITASRAPWANPPAESSEPLPTPAAQQAGDPSIDFRTMTEDDIAQFPEADRDALRKAVSALKNGAEVAFESDEDEYEDVEDEDGFEGGVGSGKGTVEELDAHISQMIKEL